MTTQLTDATTIRMAELVDHLTGAGRADAADAVVHLHPGGALSADAALAVVARAVHELGGPASGTGDAPRVTRYVRAGRPLVIDLRDRPGSGSAHDSGAQGLRIARYVPDRPSRADLVEHRSLRRWERSRPVATAAEAICS